MERITSLINEAASEAQAMIERREGNPVYLQLIKTTLDFLAGICPKIITNKDDIPE